MHRAGLITEVKQYWPLVVLGWVTNYIEEDLFYGLSFILA